MTIVIFVSSTEEAGYIFWLQSSKFLSSMNKTVEIIALFFMFAMEFVKFIIFF